MVCFIQCGKQYRGIQGMQGEIAQMVVTGKSQVQILVREGFFLNREKQFSQLLGIHAWSSSGSPTMFQT